jgi:CRISPR-associated protein Cas6
MTTALDLVFPVVQGLVVPIDHGHMLYGACKQAAPALGGIRLGIHTLRGTPLPQGLLHLGQRSRLRLRLEAERIPLALPLAGRELRLGSHLLRLGAPQVEALEPHPNLYARTVVIAKGEQGDGNRPASEAETVEKAKTAAPGATVIVLGRRTIRIHGVQIPGFELVLEGVDPATSLRLQAEGLGGRRAFGCGLFVNAGVRKAGTAVLAAASSDEVGHA